MQEFLKIDHMTFGFGSRVILDDVSLSFGKGQVVAVMGGSGMGKTTILKLIGGLLKPWSGHIYMAGEDVHALSREKLFGLRRRMGMLFQFGALFTDLSVFENVAFASSEVSHGAPRGARPTIALIMTSFLDPHDDLQRYALSVRALFTDLWGVDVFERGSSDCGVDPGGALPGLHLARHAGGSLAGDYPYGGCFLAPHPRI